MNQNMQSEFGELVTLLSKLDKEVQGAIEATDWLNSIDSKKSAAIDPTSASESERQGCIFAQGNSYCCPDEAASCAGSQGFGGNISFDFKLLPSAREPWQPVRASEDTDAIVEPTTDKGACDSDVVPVAAESWPSTPRLPSMESAAVPAKAYESEPLNSNPHGAVGRLPSPTAPSFRDQVPQRSHDAQLAVANISSGTHLAAKPLETTKCIKGDDCGRAANPSSRPVEEWSAEDVQVWAASLPQMPAEVVQILREHDVRGASLPRSESELDHMGIKRFGWRRRLMLAISALLEKVPDHSAKSNLQAGYSRATSSSSHHSFESTANPQNATSELLGTRFPEQTLGTQPKRSVAKAVENRIGTCASGKQFAKPMSKGTNATASRVLSGAAVKSNEAHARSMEPKVRKSGSHRVRIVDPEKTDADNVPASSDRREDAQPAHPNVENQTFEWPSMSSSQLRAIRSGSICPTELRKSAENWCAPPLASDDLLTGALADGRDTCHIVDNPTFECSNIPDRHPGTWSEQTLQTSSTTSVVESFAPQTDFDDSLTGASTRFPNARLIVDTPTFECHSMSSSHPGAVEAESTCQAATKNSLDISFSRLPDPDDPWSLDLHYPNVRRTADSHAFESSSMSSSHPGTFRSEYTCQAVSKTPLDISFARLPDIDDPWVGTSAHFPNACPIVDTQTIECSNISSRHPGTCRSDSTCQAASKTSLDISFARLPDTGDPVAEIATQFQQARALVDEQEFECSTTSSSYAGATRFESTCQKMSGSSHDNWFAPPLCSEGPSARSSTHGIGEMVYGTTNALDYLSPVRWVMEECVEKAGANGSTNSRTTIRTLLAAESTNSLGAIFHDDVSTKEGTDKMGMNSVGEASSQNSFTDDKYVSSASDSATTLDPDLTLNSSHHAVACMTELTSTSTYITLPADEVRPRPPVDSNEFRFDDSSVISGVHSTNFAQTNEALDALLSKYGDVVGLREEAPHAFATCDMHAPGVACWDGEKHSDPVESRLRWNAGGNTRDSLLSSPSLRVLSPNARGHSLESLTWTPSQIVTRSPCRTPPVPARIFPSEERPCSPEPRGAVQSGLEVTRPRHPNVPPLRLQSPDPPRCSLIPAPKRNDSVPAAGVASQVEHCQAPSAVVRASSPVHVVRPSSPSPPTPAINQALVGPSQRAATVTWPFAATSAAHSPAVVQPQNHSPVRRKSGNQIMSAGKTSPPRLLQPVVTQGLASSLPIGGVACPRTATLPTVVAAAPLEVEGAAVSSSAAGPVLDHHSCRYVGVKATKGFLVEKEIRDAVKKPTEKTSFSI